MTYAGPGPGAVVPDLGDGLITRQDAADWLKEQKEMLVLKPSLWGLGFDLRAVGQRLQKWWCEKVRTP